MMNRAARALEKQRWKLEQEKQTWKLERFLETKTISELAPKAIVADVKYLLEADQGSAVSLLPLLESLATVLTYRQKVEAAPHRYAPRPGLDMLTVEECIGLVETKLARTIQTVTRRKADVETAIALAGLQENQTERR
jgi:hypothetical protein